MQSAIMTVFDKVVTARGSPNIAFIKYWGKRDEKLILPCNSSLSMTLSSDTLNTTTSVLISKKLEKDAFYIDGVLQDLQDPDVKERFEIVNKLRKMAKVKEKMLIVSKNNFPASSGMASSASGIATLIYVLNAALELKLTQRELSIIARQGSGSACRSVFGGIVVWKKGSNPDGTDSYAEQIFDENYWAELTDNIVIVTQEKKKVSSRAGMKQTVQTNPLYEMRYSSSETHIKEFVDAYKDKDFHRIADIIIADSNEMHALMLSTKPSIRYLNKASYAIMDAIEELNAKEGKNIAAYTFDAGANAHIITLASNREKVMNALKHLQDSKEIIEIKSSKIGGAPFELNETESLIDMQSMSPYN